MKIWIGPTGRLSAGHVLDSAKAPLERALRDFDSQLYVRWNPNKLKGHGCWELRRRPELKSCRQTEIRKDATGNAFRVIAGDFFDMGDGSWLCYPKYHENNYDNHIKDFAFLNYSMINWLKDHDLWKYGYKGKDAVREAEYREAKYDEKTEENAVSELEYNLKQIAPEMRDFKEYIASGGNPHRIANHWK